MGKYVFKEHRITVPYKILVCSIQSGDKNTVTVERKEGADRAGVGCGQGVAWAREGCVRSKLGGSQ